MICYGIRLDLKYSLLHVFAMKAHEKGKEKKEGKRKNSMTLFATRTQTQSLLTISIILPFVSPHSHL